MTAGRRLELKQRKSDTFRINLVITGRDTHRLKIWLLPPIFLTPFVQDCQRCLVAWIAGRSYSSKRRVEESHSIIGDAGETEHTSALNEP